MSLRGNWNGAEKLGHQLPEAEGAGHRRYAKAWELHKLGVPVMSPNGWPDPALTDAALDGMLAAEMGRRAKLYQAFVRAGSATIFRALGVQILAGDDSVYTIGNQDPLTQTNSSRPLGLLAGAEAMVTDGLQVRSHGRAMFLPLALTALAAKTMADAAVVFPDGTVHARSLHGNNEICKAQKQAARFNALAGAAAPGTAEMDAGHVTRLQNLQELWEAGLLSQQEYDTRRAEIIASF